MSYEHGRILNVQLVTYGSELAADTAAGATTLVVEDAADFDETGGHLLVNDELIAYTAVDDETGAIALATPLITAAEEGDRVKLFDPLYSTVTTEKLAFCKVDGDEDDADPVEATLALHLVDKIEEGIRGVTGESVLLELDGDEWRVVDVLGFGDPETGAGATKFYQDQTTVATVGDQTVHLTFEPIAHSEHVYWNGIYQPGSEWSRTGQVVAVTDDDSVIEVDDILVVEYAYRSGFGAPIIPGVETPIDPAPATDPIIYDGSGTGGGVLVGSGGVWSDDNPATGVELHAVDNALGRDSATIQMESNTGLGLVTTGITVFADLSFTIVDYINIRVQLCESSDLSFPVPFMSGVYTGPGGSVSIDLTGDLAHFLGRMDADLPVWLRMNIDADVAPVGFDQVFVSEARIRIAEVDE